MTAIAESKNVAIRQAFANSVWPDFATFVTSASELPPDDLPKAPEIEQLREAVLAEMTGLSIVKVKVYDLDDLTVFSTEAAPISQDKSHNEGFIIARAGQMASELTYRETFSIFEEMIEDRNVYSSYIPSRPDGGQIEGVFKLYDDVTPLLERIETSQRTVFFKRHRYLSAALWGAISPKGKSRISSSAVGQQTRPSPPLPPSYILGEGGSLRHSPPSPNMYEGVRG